MENHNTSERIEIKQIQIRPCLLGQFLLSILQTLHGMLIVVLKKRYFLTLELAKIHVDDERLESVVSSGSMSGQH